MDLILPIIDPTRSVPDQVDAATLAKLSVDYLYFQALPMEYIDEDGAGVGISLLVVGDQTLANADGEVPVFTFMCSLEIAAQLGETLSVLSATIGVGGTGG